MSYHPVDPAARFRARIDLEKPREVKYWTSRFGVTPQQLQAAVEKVGASAAAVAALLRKS